MTGVKLGAGDYKDESTDEEDITVVFNNFIGYDSAVNEASANMRADSA